MPLPPPLAISVPSTPERTTLFATFAPGSVVCDGRTIAPVALVPPFAGVATRYGTPDVEPPRRYRFTFAIDAAGRPRTIRKGEAMPGPGPYFDPSDLAPSLAASRFPAGAAHAACAITYAVTVTPLAAVPLPAVYELASRVDPLAPAARDLFDRARLAGSTCARGPGQYRRLNYPAFEKIPPPAAGQDWTFLRYDVGTDGTPRNIAVLGTSGNAALDRAGRRALAANRYAPGPGYRGCTYHFHRARTAPIAAPDLPPDTPTDSDQPAACRIDPRTIPRLLDGTAYPTGFARRRIEGVVVLGYDTAPWGALGNVKVIAAEPDDTFGEVARSVFYDARVAESDTGQRGCVRRIRFQLPPDATRD